MPLQLKGVDVVWRCFLIVFRFGEALALPPVMSGFTPSCFSLGACWHRRHRLQVMVTAGGNQAFAMVALAVLDPGDRVLLVRPKMVAVVLLLAVVFAPLTLSAVVV